jgi:hypothetical protein
LVGHRKNRLGGGWRINDDRPRTGSLVFAIVCNEPRTAGTDQYDG